MADAKTPDLLRFFDEALAKIEDQQRKLDQERAIIRRNRQELVATISQPAGTLGPISPSLSVGDEKIAAVREYLAEEGAARQSDIGPATGLNSGSVSVALRRLEASGEVIRGRKIRGSQQWISSRSKDGALHEPGAVRDDRLAAA